MPRDFRHTAEMNRIPQLFDAIRNGDAAGVRALLSAEPGLAEARNNDGATPVLWAVYTRHPELVEVVLGGRAPDFFEACALGRPGRVSELLAQSPGLVDEYSADGFTALGLAVFLGHLDVARMLVERGADVNLPSRNALRVAPLHSAVASGKVELLDLLLSHGAKPDCAEAVDATPLHSAAGHGSREMVRRLLAAGADRDCRTKDGKTAADLAREYGHAELAAELE
jgi:ankyrin repeat protein